MTGREGRGDEPECDFCEMPLVCLCCDRDTGEVGGHDKDGLPLCPCGEPLECTHCAALG